MERSASIRELRPRTEYLIPSTGQVSRPTFKMMAQYVFQMNRVGKLVPPKQHILRDISLSFFPGAKIGVLGLNGAGKSTLMKVLTGYLQPDEGQVWIDNLDVLTDTLAVQERIGYLPETAPLYPEFSVQAHLNMMADLRRIPAADKPALISRAVRATALENHLTRPIGELSKGYRQRVGLAQTILHNPSLLILDEPTAGLDPTQIVEARHLIRRMAERSTVLLSTHILSEVEATCDRVIILLNGKVRYDARLSDLSSHGDTILILQDGTEDATTQLKSIKSVETVKAQQIKDGWEYRLLGRGGADLRPAVYELTQQFDWPLRELRREVRTLETVFNELVTENLEQWNES